MTENLMQQIPLDFGSNDKSKTPKTENENLEDLSTKELESRYKANVGKDPQFRFRSETEAERRRILIEGIRDKEKALNRLRIIDAADKNEGDAHFRK